MNTGQDSGTHVTGSIVEGALRLLPCTEGTCFSPLIRRERAQDLSMSRRLTGDRRGMVTAKRIQKHEVWYTQELQEDLSWSLSTGKENTGRM